jgi:DNA polymerase-3 subunit delta'
MWQEIEGHEPVIERFRTALLRRRLAGTFLFVGPAGVGKMLVALKLAQALLCERRPCEALDPCGACPACQQVAAESHPDLRVVRKHKDRVSLTIDLLIGDRDHRREEGLCYWVSLKPVRGTWKIGVIHDADLMQAEAANCLLKTLEEPPPGSILILIASSPQRILPTIRSRAQIVRFEPLSHEVMRRLIRAQGLAPDDRGVEVLLELAEGSIGRAAELADPACGAFRERMYQSLGELEWDAGRLRDLISSFASPEREARSRMQLATELACGFYRALLRTALGSAVEGDPALTGPVTRLARRWPHGPEAIADCLDRCLLARRHVDVPAHVRTLIDAWLDDLSAIVRTGRPLAVEPGFPVV